jgi:class 3 adenylate cyclase
VWQFVGEERLQSTAMILITTGDPRRCDGHCGRLVKSTGDGVLLEFPSVVDAVECAAAVQAVTAERNQGVPQDRRMLFRIGINLGDILIEGTTSLVTV